MLVGWYMWTSKFFGSDGSCDCTILSLFLELECERDLENLESLGLEEFIYFEKLISRE